MITVLSGGTGTPKLLQGIKNIIHEKGGRAFRAYPQLRESALCQLAIRQIGLER